MTIRVVCTKCHKNLSAPDDSLGKMIRCPQCGKILKVEKWHAKAAGIDVDPGGKTPGSARSSAGGWIVGAVVAVIVLGILGAIAARMWGGGETPPADEQPPAGTAPADGQPVPATQPAGKSANRGPASGARCAV